jgi:hypothetical protein
MPRAKFTCLEVAKRKNWDPAHPFVSAAKFTAVTSGSEENKSFFASTPSGTIELATVAPDVFEPGKDYYVDFTEAQ